jgi:hypothetical protein
LTSIKPVTARLANPPLRHSQRNDSLIVIDEEADRLNQVDGERWRLRYSMRARTST